MSTIVKKKQNGKRYCVICHNFEGKVLENGVKVSLHRFPQNMEVRKQWIRNVKLVRKDFVDEPTDGHRVCDIHFEGGFAKGKTPRILSATAVKMEKDKKGAQNRRQRRGVIAHTRSQDVGQIHAEIHAEEHVEDIEMVNASDTEASTCDKSTQVHSETKDQGFQVGKSYICGELKDVGVNAFSPFITAEDLSHSDEKVRFYTGFGSYEMFFFMFSLLLKHGADKLNYWKGEESIKETLPPKVNSKTGPKRSLRPIDEFVMMCMKLRLNFPQEHLALLFSVSRSTVSRILNTWINFTYDHCKSMVAWPTQEQILQNLPAAFSNFPDCSVILDCTEIFTEKPSSLEAQWLTWSEYKHNNTFKVLIGVTPSGMVNFVSRVWGGRASDRHITQKDGVLPLIPSGTVIMADKGFTIEDLLPADVGLNMPPRLKGKKQFSKKEVLDTAQIASARIVCEMKMEQAKNYRVISSIIPLSEAHLAEQMIFLCFAFTNLMPPLLK